MTEYRAYTGIGSRETPESLIPTITRIANRLGELGYVLRSGGAEGADTYFEEAASEKEIYLPWRGFNGRIQARLHGPSPAAMRLASERIRGFNRRTQGVQKLLARNMHQILGEDLATPTRVVVCWTPGGHMRGGTAHAWKLAIDSGVQVFNLARPYEIADILDKLNSDKWGDEVSQ